MRDMRRWLVRRPALTALAAVLLLAGVSGLIAAGKEDGRGYLGVSVERIAPDERAELGVEFGVRVSAVNDETAAAKAGIREDDIIQFFAGKEIHDPLDLQEAVRAMEPGAVAKVKLVRAKKALELPVTLGKMERGPSRWFHLPEGQPWVFQSGGPFLGVRLLPLDEDLSPYFGVNPNEGVLVVGVEKESPAAAAGIKGGDVITAVAGQKVKDPETVRKALGECEAGKEIDITVVRQKSEKTLKAKLEDRPSRHMEIMRMPAFPPHARAPMAFGEGWEAMPEIPDLGDLRVFEGLGGGCRCFPEGWPGVSHEKLKELRESGKVQREKMKREMDQARKKMEEARHQAESMMPEPGAPRSI